jgi:serralysin
MATLSFGSSALKLTDAVQNQGVFALYTLPVSSAQGFSITFNFYSYGGTGADGISFFLVNGNQSPTGPGGFGGSLGYAQQNTTPGLLGGYLAIGFDEFGNFSNPTEGRVGGPDETPNSIAIRGSQAINYRYLTGTRELPVSLDVPGETASRDAARRRAKVDLSPAGILSVQVDLNNDGDFGDRGEQAITSFNLIAAGNGFLPESVKFGFAAGTGQQTNIHEVDGLEIRTFAGNPIPGNVADQLLIVGGNSNETLTSGSSNDTLIGNLGNDTLIGNDGDDILSGGSGKDRLLGGNGGDRFVFAGITKPAALAASLLRSRDVIAGFRQREGDRIQLDFDNNLATLNLPKGLFNAGRIRGRNLKNAVREAYADRDQRRNGNQKLQDNQAVFFRYSGRTYLSVNDNRDPFAANRDLVVEITGMQFRPGDRRAGTLRVGNYFA